MQTKRWWQSVAVWAACCGSQPALDLAGITFDPVGGDFSGNIYTLWGSITAGVGSSWQSLVGCVPSPL